MQLNAEKLQLFLQKCNIFCKLKQIDWCKTGFYYDSDTKLGKELLHEMGVYYLQEPSAMTPVEFMQVKQDDKVLDLCASPGGKTTQIAEKLNNTNGILISNEIIPSRAKVLTENVHRLGFGNVTVTNHSPKELEKIFFEYFDRILVDAPCSGEGMFRKNSDAILQWNAETPIQCAKRQTEIIESAYKMLKSGGTMVYSTCTFSLEENEMIIVNLLQNHSDLELVKIDHEKYNFDKGITIQNDLNLDYCARLYPYHIDGEGHFFAVIKKQNKDKNLNNEQMILEAKYGKKVKNKQKMQENWQKIDIFKQFQQKYLNLSFDNFVMLGDDIYANSKLNLNGLKVLSTGIYLGKIINTNFTPSLNLAHFLTVEQCKRTYELNERDAKKYLEGYELDTQIDDGWMLLTYQNIPLAFGKVVKNKIKNHYPKNMRKKI